MLTETGSAIYALDRQITQQLNWERQKQANRRVEPCSLTDDDLEFIEHTPGALKDMGKYDALFGEGARYPKSATYMAVYRRQQRLMAERNEGPRCPLPMSTAGWGWGEGTAAHADVFAAG